MTIYETVTLPFLCSQVPDINTDILFGNLFDVTRLSCDFLTALEDSCRNQQAVGEVFVTFAPKLRDVYAAYCRNHDTASAILEKVCLCMCVFACVGG